MKFTLRAAYTLQYTHYKRRFNYHCNLHNADRDNSDDYLDRYYNLQRG